MPSSFPGALDSFTNPTASDNLDSVAVPHATQHANLNDAVEAIQAELGTDPSGAAASVKARFEAIEANNWVTNARMADNAVGAAEVIDGAITIGKLGSTATTKNLLTPNQASLETDTTGWAAAGAGSIARSTAQAWTGAASLINTSGGAGNTDATTPSGTSGIPVVPGRIYTASAYLRSAAITSGAAVFIEWFTAAGAVISAVGFTPSGALSSSAWTRWITTGVAPATAAFARVCVRWSAAGASEVVYIDGIGFWEGAGGAWVNGGERLDPATLGFYWDESVGRRQFMWDTVNNRWQMVYGDTGWRDNAIPLVNGWATYTSLSRLRRVGNQVFYRHYLDKTNATSDVVCAAWPAGFTPGSASGYIGLCHQNGSATPARFDYSVNVPNALSIRRSDVSWIAYIDLVWSTTDAWPTSLPGSAIGAIPTP